ncbi:MAG: DNA polymerase IV, partial [Bacteroidales bacterium]
EYTDLVEPLSLDEAFLDVTSNKKNILSATLIAGELKERIKKETQLTASAGVSVNKFLAKIASDIKKPDGLFVIPPEKAVRFVEELEIEKFYGIGRVTAGRMHELGIKKGADLKKWEKADLIRLFGKAGSYYYDIARAIDNRPVNPERIRKSIGTEYTFEKDLETDDEISRELYAIEKELMRRIRKSGRSGRTLTLKVKFSDFRQITRSLTVPYEIRKFEDLHHVSRKILHKTNLTGKKIRLIGLTVSNLQEEDNMEDTQLTLNL